MKRSNKKGFTIVELVVVIAVIAILAAVMIPTFSGVIGKADAAALKSELKAAYTQYTYDKADANEEAAHDLYIKYDGKFYLVQNGNIETAAASTPVSSLDDLCVNDEGFVDGTVFERYAAAHVYDDDADTTCNKCAYVRTVG